MTQYQENILTGNQVLTGGWLRQLQIKFTSLYNPSYSVTIGDNTDGYNYEIRVNGTKHVGIGKADGGTVTITNMEPDVIATIIAAKLYTVEINFGYKSAGSTITFAKGEVAYISQKPHSRHDTYIYITYASQYVARMKQGMMGFFVNSGINLWTVLNYLDPSLKKSSFSSKLAQLALNEAEYYTDSESNIIESITKGSELITSTDSSIGSLVTITELKEKRVIKLSPTMIMFNGGNPTLTSSGLSIRLFPLFNYVPGDILQLDNGIIDLSSGTNNYDAVINASDLNGAYIDINGQYMIQEINYTFENRGDTAEIACLCKALTLIKNVGGGK